MFPSFGSFSQDMPRDSVCAFGHLQLKFLVKESNTSRNHLRFEANVLFFSSLLFVGAPTSLRMEVAWCATYSSVSGNVWKGFEEEQCMEGGNFCQLLSTPEPWQEVCVEYTLYWQEQMSRWWRDGASPVPAKAPGPHRAVKSAEYDCYHCVGLF